MKRPAALIATIIFFTSVSFAVGMTKSQGQKEVMTNADVIQLVKLGLGEAVIIQKIRQSEPKFDTSNAGLAQLKSAKVTDNIIMEMMSPGSSGNLSSPPSTAPSPNSPRQPSMTDPFGIPQPNTANATGAGRVIYVDADKRIDMKYSTPESRSNSMLGAVVNPFHKSRIRAALKGNHASLRISNNLPLFEISVEKDANPTDIVAVVKLEPKSDTREIEAFRGGITGVSSGYRKQDLVPMTIEETTSGSSGQRVYRIKLVNPLAPGEYALVYRSAAYYDFGVDGVK
jgi:hypothetical protein